MIRVAHRYGQAAVTVAELRLTYERLDALEKKREELTQVQSQQERRLTATPEDEVEKQMLDNSLPRRLEGIAERKRQLEGIESAVGEVRVRIAKLTAYLDDFRVIETP